MLWMACVGSVWSVRVDEEIWSKWCELDLWILFVHRVRGDSAGASIKINNGEFKLCTV